MDKEALQKFEKDLKERYPLGIPRKRIAEATGYILHPRTCANEDSLGDGIPGRFKVGRNTIYPVSGVIFKIRSKIVE